MLPKRCENPVYVRHEKNNYCSIDSIEYGLKVLNPTATFIFDNCDGVNTTNDLINLMHKKYPSVDLGEITNDVKEILYYLKDLKLLEFEDEKGVEGISFKTASDYDFSDMKKFIIANSKREDVFIYEKSPVYYQEHLIRSRQFALSEITYICRKEGKINHLITLNQIDMLTGTTKITLFICDFTDSSFGDFLSYVLNDIKKFDVNKVEFHDIEGINTFTQYDKLGFNQEAILKKEYKGKDIIVYSRFI